MYLEIFTPPISTPQLHSELSYHRISPCYSTENTTRANTSHTHCFNRRFSVYYFMYANTIENSSFTGENKIQKGGRTEGIVYEET